MKTAISIPDEVFESADEVAHRLGMSRSEVYVTALKSFLEKHQFDRITEKLNEIYTQTPSDLDTTLRNMQTRSLGKVKW